MEQLVFGVLTYGELFLLLSIVIVGLFAVIVGQNRRTRQDLRNSQNLTTKDMRQLTAVLMHMRAEDSAELSKDGEFEWIVGDSYATISYKESDPSSLSVDGRKETIGTVYSIIYSQK